jgi:pseudaminic acid biosynthesis-associated methylase
MNAEQDAFWAGKFGSQYAMRNSGTALLASNLNFFAKALKCASGIESCLEVGANIGMNLMALKLLYPEMEQYAVEINPDAVEQLSRVIPPAHITQRSIVGYVPSCADLVFTSGVLIHLDPESLPSVYDSLVCAANKYLLIAEYYNQTPVAIDYRGEKNKLFKRDFAGEIMDRNPQMHLIDYGFAYQRDQSHPKDDLTWFLMERK